MYVRTKKLISLIYKEFLQINKKKTTYADNIGKAHKQKTQKLKSYIKYNNKKWKLYIEYSMYKM